MLNSRFWRDRRVFITGHTGFKGSWLCLLLSRLGARVTGYALAPPTDPSLFKLARIEELITHVEADVRDYGQLHAAMAAARPDIVLHLAAQSLVRLSYQIPLQTVETNVMGTANLLEAIRATGGVRAAVMITSDKCYENPETIWALREDDPMGGHDPYSVSKGCAELVVSAWRRSYFTPAERDRHGLALASARAGNVIGGGDWALDRLIPDIIRALAESKAPEIRFPGAIRPWQHVLEPLTGYLMLAESLFGVDGVEFASGWNFGPHENDARPVGWITDHLCALWGDGADWARPQDKQHPHEANWLKLDSTKARTYLNWRPRWSLDQALSMIVQWHKAHLAGADMRQVTLEQIDRFVAETPAD